MTAESTAPFSAAAIAAASTKSDEPKTVTQIIAYSPRQIVGGAPHPGVIVEPAGLANVEPPPINYRPHLPTELATTGKLSAMQIERIIYAGQAHERRLVI